MLTVGVGPYLYVFTLYNDIPKQYVCWLCFMFSIVFQRFDLMLYAVICMAQKPIFDLNKKSIYNYVYPWTIYRLN